MPDIATLGVRVQQTGAEQVTAQLNAVGAAGERAGASVVGAMTPVSESFMASAASAADFARAGATAAQVAQLTGASMAQARIAVATFGGTTAETAAEVRGLALAEQEAAAASVELGAAATTGGLGLGRLRQSMATLAAESLGMNPIAGRLGSTMAGAFGAGTVAIIGLLGGIAATRAIYNAWNEDAEKAQGEQDKLTDSLTKWYEKMKEGPGGEFSAQIVAMTQKVADLKKQLDGVSENKMFSGIQAVGAGGSRVDAWVRILTAGNPAQIAEQFGLEVGKGSAKMAHDIKEGGAAIAAARDASANQIAESNRKLAEAQLHLSEPKTDAYVANLLKATDATNAMNKATADDARLAALSGTAHEIMAARIKAENEQIAANAQLTGEALVLRTAAIQASYDSAKQTLLEAQANQELAESAIYLDKVRKDLKPAAIPKTDQVSIDQKTIADSAAKAMREQQAIVDTALKDEQRAFADFFDNIFTKGTASFRNLFGNIRDLFFKMVADIAAADLVKKISAPLTAVIGGMLGTPSTANAMGFMPGQIPLSTNVHSTAATVGAGAMIAGAGFGVGSMFGGFAQSHGLGEVGAGLGGAAGGAAIGAGIGALGGPIGVVAGAFIGGVAGAVGGLLGFTHSASEAAKELLAFKTASDSVSGSLADWRAQITGTAADQKAAALLDLQVKYDQIQQTINQSLAGKKHEQERNAQLSEAKSLYDQNKKAIDDNTGAWRQNTGPINAVQGYRYESLYYGSMPVVGQQPGTDNGGGTARTTPGGAANNRQPIVIQNVMVLDGKVVAKSVLKTFQDAARRSLVGDSTRWSEITAVT